MQAQPMDVDLGGVGVVIMVGYAILGLFSLGALVCQIMVLVEMFKRGQTGLGIACAILSFCGIGVLVNYIFGWVKSAEWGLKKVMLVWTACIVLSMITFVGIGIAAAATVMNNPELQKQFQEIQELQKKQMPVGK